VKGSQQRLPFRVFGTLTFVNLLYLIRHGQAGTRDEYDRLSALGQAQASALGVWLAREGVRFDTVWTGALRRQQETATYVLGAMAEAGSPQPEPSIDPRWNEFDLDVVNDGIATQMAAEDPDFRSHLHALAEAVASGDAAIHRRWTPADAAVVEAWIAGRYSFEGESWADFIARVRSAAREPLAAAQSGGSVAVFTSATPVAITMGLALPLRDADIMPLAEAAINSNVTILSVKEGQPRLFAFNGIAHLESPTLRTFR
jgi:broad specificity phosphatase PhoE